jgi:hypothetical protein
MSESEQQNQLDVSESSAGRGTEDSTETDDSAPVDPTSNGWTGFRKGGNKFVTVRSSGSIAPNSAVVRDHFGDADAVQLFFKEEDNLIGVQPVDAYDDEDDRLYKISEDGGSISINTHAFMKAWDIEHDETIRYRPEWDDEMQMLIVDLDDDGEVVESGKDEDNEV